MHYGTMDNCRGLIFMVNDKVYTEREYGQLIKKRELIKDTVKIIAFTVIYGGMVILRAYTFFKYGV